MFPIAVQQALFNLPFLLLRYQLGLSTDIDPGFVVTEDGALIPLLERQIAVLRLLDSLVQV
jgi:hypothetical protein